MLEITNKNKFPVQLVVRSRKSPRSFTTKIVPGMGCGKNICEIADEIVTEYIDRAEKDGLISTRYIPNKLRKGE
jgi:hypothetical protein